MCGIAGLHNLDGSDVHSDVVQQMLAQIQYRGPDESGIYIGHGTGMGSVRLSIIDLTQGQQPMSAFEGRYWIVFNGEIFNYIELRKELKDLGYDFRTSSDTEVLLKLYIHYREMCLEKLNGQFCFAIWDRDKRELFLARDRMGIRPLFYHHSGSSLVFGSEIKCIIESGWVQPEIDPLTLNQVFTFWTIPSPGSLFKGIVELPPGHYLSFSHKGLSIKPYWHLRFNPVQGGERSLEEAKEEFESLISDSVRLRLRSDVQVAAYLSGGIDSSATTYYIKSAEPGVLNTFSVGFEDAEFDEKPFQEIVSGSLETIHKSILCKKSDIADYFPKVLWHTEIPLLRTGAVPMYVLSGLVHENGIKVVITGEGADEFLGGYNIFKEALIREFWSRDPDSRLRPLLLQKLYPYLKQFQGARSNMFKFFYGYGLTQTDSPVYSHMIRWHNSRHIKHHLHPDLGGELGSDPVERVIRSLPGGMEEWDLLSRAQWLESTYFLSGYLLSSQGDRMAMANSVEGRYPFLDHRVIEFCATLPENMKIRGLTEKYLLKKVMQGRLPGEVLSRPKQAYRAPVAVSFLSGSAPDYVREMLSPSRIADKGFFNPDTVRKLVDKLEGGKQITENDNMALCGILSTQLLSDLFVKGNNPYREESLRTHCPVYLDGDKQNLT